MAGAAPRPKKPRRDPTAAEADPRFLRFWAAYPRHEKRAETAIVFARLDPGPELVEEIVAAIDRQKRDGCLVARTADGRDVRPHPTTWLNGRRWQDGAKEPATLSIPPRERARHQLLKLVGQQLMTKEDAEKEFGGPIDEPVVAA